MSDVTSPPEAGQIKIKEAIIKTIVFFDIFSFPLTRYELWRFLGKECTYYELEEALVGLDNSIISGEGAFYFLKGRSELIDIRNRRYNYSNRKMKRAKRISKVFRYIPWIKMIAIGNIMGSNNLRDGSDIDFFIICEKNRVWISRFISTLITKILLLRPRINDVRDKICLSFYLSETSLNLLPFHLENGHDPYFTYWLANLIPVYETDDSYAKLLKENDWMYKNLPNWQPAVSVSVGSSIIKPPGFFYKDIMELFFGGLDSVLRALQMKILPNDLRLAMNKDNRVVINNGVLKLHLKDRRKNYREMLEDGLDKISKSLKY